MSLYIEQYLYNLSNYINIYKIYVYIIYISVTTVYIFIEAYAVVGEFHMTFSKNLSVIYPSLYSSSILHLHI